MAKAISKGVTLYTAGAGPFAWLAVPECQAPNTGHKQSGSALA